METTNNISNYPTATPESVWAALRDLTERQAETDKLIKESRVESDRQLKESRADYDQRMKDLNEKIGSWSNNHGFIAEEYFFNSFEQGKQNFFGEHFDTIRRNVKPHENIIKDDEYDIVMINGKSVAIIEVKFKAHENDIPDVLNKVETYRANFPKHAHLKIYLGLASKSFYSQLEKACNKAGIAIIKQVGDKIIINQDNLKVY